MVQETFGFPLSFGQERLWFLNNLEPGNPFYNISGAIHAKGRLDIGGLERSLNEIVSRHETLRTTFITLDDEAVQVVGPALKVELPVISLEYAPRNERYAEALRVAGKEAFQPFDLRRGPLLRSTLLRLDDEEYVVLFTIHHIVSDGWSLGVLIEEVSILYEAFSNGRSSPLPPLPIQYADFAIWQRRRLQGRVLDVEFSYWKHKLGGVLPILSLPVDHSRPALQTYRGAHESFTLPVELYDSLKELGRRSGATLFATILAAFNVLLYRYTGQQDIIVGAPEAGRARSETKLLIGFFVNTLALRTDLSGDPSFSELLARVRQVVAEAQAHADLPFEKLVEMLQPNRDMSRNPIFQVVLVLQNLPMQPLNLSGIKLTPLQIENKTAKFDLTLILQEVEDRLTGLLEYNSDLFEPDSINRMLGHFEVLLKGIVAGPGQRISSLRLMDEEETAGLGPSHFPKAKLSQKQFEDLLLAINNTANQG